MIGTNETTTLAEYYHDPGLVWSWDWNNSASRMHITNDSAELVYRFNYNFLQDPKSYNCEVLSTYQWVNKPLNIVH